MAGYEPCRAIEEIMCTKKSVRHSVPVTTLMEQDFRKLELRLLSYLQQQTIEHQQWMMRQLTQAGAYSGPSVWPKIS